MKCHIEVSFLEDTDTFAWHQVPCEPPAVSGGSRPQAVARLKSINSSRLSLSPSPGSSSSIILILSSVPRERAAFLSTLSLLLRH